MAKHYRETPWYWYMVVLVFSFILGLIVVVKENITLSAWAYVVSLLLGIFIAPFVSMPTYGTYPRGDVADHNVEHPPLLSLRQRYRHQQSVKNAGRLDGSGTSNWKHVLCRLVAQCYFKHGQSLQ